ncbi:hypothetical protein ACF1B0_15130 [Streptomyces anandii]|uniref:hypothetical protein n=1 Tax=Streptomyces anandii TaxID=285454 RepID=UPI0036FC2A3C
MNVAEEIMRFAELAARTGLEPELARRFESDPAAVLREFGLPAGGAGAPAVLVAAAGTGSGPGTGTAAAAGGDRVVESLGAVGTDSPAGWCVCWAPELPFPGVSE